jgi:hypothetical protein
MIDEELSEAPQLHGSLELARGGGVLVREAAPRQRRWPPARRPLKQLVAAIPARSERVSEPPR